ncbi:MAG: hypothetical protein ACTSX0_08685 [Promethearchaeota archaeon]
MRKNRIFILSLIIISVFLTGTIFSLTNVSASGIQDNSSFLGYDLGVFNTPVNTTLNYSIHTGEGLGYFDQINQSTILFNSKNGVNDKYNSEFFQKTYYQFNSVYLNKDSAYFNIDLFSIPMIFPHDISFSNNDDWEYLYRDEFQITPIFKDIYSFFIFPTDVDCFTIFPNSSAPILAEALFWDDEFDLSYFYSQAIYPVQNVLNYSVFAFDWNYSRYCADWNISGYSSTNEVINLEMTFNSTIWLSEDGFIQQYLYNFTQDISVSEPDFSDTIAMHYRKEYYANRSLIYRGNMHLEAPETTIDDYVDDDWDSWEGETFSETQNLALLSVVLLVIGVIVGLIFLIFIISSIFKMKPASFPAEQARAGNISRENFTIRQKSTKVSRTADGVRLSTKFIPRFCPICGTPVSEVMAELLQKERYAFCESCGEKIEL